jgi:hypothetical protein
MIITKELDSLYNFDAWSGAVETKEEILNQGYDEEFIRLIEELYPDGIDETDLNDLLWFESTWIYETLGMDDPYAEEEEDEEEEEEEEENEK